MFYKLARSCHQILVESTLTVNKGARLYFCSSNNFKMSQTEAQSKLNLVKDVDIDPQGRFKYILIKLYIDRGESSDDEEDVFKFIVRGYGDCEYHADIYDRCCASISKIRGLDTECVGGGRILHENNKITVFGYSQGYGRADHQKSVQILKKAYPNYEISWNNDGY